MRIAAIISAWSDTKELLPFCIESIRPVVDSVIVVYSEMSNHFNHDDSITELIFSKLPCQWVKLEPERGRVPHDNETRKRNFGLGTARMQGFTHCILMDSDEFYFQDEFNREKERMISKNLNGIVCPVKAYVKSPTLSCDDYTLVPAIQRLTTQTTVGNFKKYPFNIDPSGNSRIDPTRRLNYTHGIEMSEMFMHHYSYVRKDINLKIMNSSANLRRSATVIHDELRDAKPGYMSKLYHKELKESPNYFNIYI